MNSVQTGLVRSRLRELHAALRGHFGYHPDWWPGTPWQIALSAILVQQCDWRAAWTAIGRLEQAGRLSPPALAETSEEEIRSLINGVSFTPTKAGRIQRFARFVEQASSLVQRDPTESRGRTLEMFLSSADTATLRTQLLSQQGIGPETADCILLYAGAHPVFVIDAYTRRIFSRLRIIAVDDAFWKQPYATLQAFFSEHLIADAANYPPPWDPRVPQLVALFRDYHALLVELGRHHCLKTKPRCNTAGRNGWDDYQVCLTHCAHTGSCSACPARHACRNSPGRPT